MRMRLRFHFLRESNVGTQLAHVYMRNSVLSHVGVLLARMRKGYVQSAFDAFECFAHDGIERLGERNQ
jgi:hypothetical protein